MSVAPPADSTQSRCKSWSCERSTTFPQRRPRPRIQGCSRRFFLAVLIDALGVSSSGFIGGHGAVARNACVLPRHSHNRRLTLLTRRYHVQRPYPPPHVSETGCLGTDDSLSSGSGQGQRLVHNASLTWYSRTPAETLVKSTLPLRIKIGFFELLC